MGRWLKRLLLLLVVGAGTGAAYRLMQQRQASARALSLGPSTEWPPFAPSPPPATPHPTELDRLVEVHAPAADWKEAVDGTCPDGYPIKANNSSHIFHVPGGRFYERTIPERCYSSVEAAERDGYRRAKA